MDSFVTIRDRDAWATIRGYVYQVDQTIHSWLNLQPSQVLELERGEDIDVVFGTIDLSGEEQSRLLEQIKYLDKNITLRTPQVLEALASFHEHLVHNPSINLSLAFVTNSEPTVERPSPMPKGKPGIVIWRELCSGSIHEKERRAALRGIRAVLSTAVKPENLRPETWVPFHTFITGCGDDELIEFIRRIEWKTRNLSANDISIHIKQQLVTHFAIAVENTQDLYHRLFVYVIRLLSRKGLKRLTSEELANQLSRPMLGEEETKLLYNVKTLLSALESRVSLLEQGHLSHERKLISIDAELERLAKNAGVSTPVSYNAELLQLDAPPLVEPVVPRDSIVARYVHELNSVTWRAFYGNMGSGKTQLAALVVQKAGRPFAWIRFRELDAAAACRRIDEALITISGVKPERNWKGYCRKACSLITPETLLVMDDLPRVTAGELLFERLAILAKECRSHNLRLVSTSHFDLPTRLKKIEGGQICRVEEVPRFNNDEIRELFEMHGASGEFFEANSVALLAALTSRHPTLLTAAAFYLEGHNWRLDDEEFDELIKGEHAREINEQTEEALLNTVPDSAARELLYRLNLVSRPFNKEDVQCVSGVAPQISHPYEKIHYSTGLWVQRDSTDSYVLSPLIHQLGSENLHPVTAREVHLTLARSILRKGEISPSEVSLVINHYVAANEYNQAASMLLWALNGMDKQEVTADPWGISSYWYSVKLPEQIHLDLRIHLRTMQAMVGEQLKKPLEFVLRDLDALIDDADVSNARAVAYASIMAGPFLVQGGMSRASRYLLKLLQVAPEGLLPDGTRLAYPEEVIWPALIWAMVRMVKSENDLNLWFATLESFTPKQLNDAFRDQLAADGSMAIADRLWSWESAKPKNKRNWKRILLQLESFAERARQLGAEILWACFIHAQIIVLAEYRHDLDAAVALCSDALDKASNEPSIQFLLRMSIGTQLADAGRSEEGITRLSEAIDQPTEVYPLFRNLTLLKLARELGGKDALRALSFIDRAIETVRRSPIMPESELIKALGEKAIALWYAGELAAAYSPLEEAAERLLAVNSRDEEGKALFLIFGHVAGFLSHLVRTGEQIQRTADDYDYTVPERGMFLKSYPLLPSTYREETVRYLPAVIALFAKGIGKEEKVAEWSLRAVDTARLNDDRTALGQVAHLALEFLVIENKIPEAFDVALHLGISMAALKIDQEAGRNPLRRDYDVLNILGPKPGEGWDEGEDYAVIGGLLPFFFHLALSRLNGDEDLNTHIEILVATCQQIAASASNPHLWTSAAALIQDFFEGKLSESDLMEKAKAFSGPHTTSLQTLALLAAALESSPEQAVYNQLETMTIIVDFFRSLGPIYERILIPFYKTFWSKTFHENRFRFRLPAMIEQSLEQISGITDWTVLPRILTLMAVSLGVAPSQRVQRWLDNNVK